jgi:hypothetical protein
MELAEGTRFCNLSESELAGVSGDCRWPMPDVAIFQALNLPNVANADAQRVWSQCAELWNAVCHLNLHLASDPSQANIYSQSGRIDGPMGVLGQSYLPCGNVGPQTQLAQLFDNNENWNLDFLLRVALHEIGHALGLPHAPRGSGAVMEPFLTAFTKPQAWDIAQMQTRYPGGPITLPTPAPGPDDPAGGDMFGKGVIINIPAAGNYLFKISMAKR